MLAFVHVKLGQSQRRTRSHDERHEREPSVGLPHEGVDIGIKKDGRQHAEADDIAQAVKLLSHRGIGIQKPSGRTVTEIEDGGSEHHVESPVGSALKSEYHTHDPAEEVECGNRIRNMLY